MFIAALSIVPKTTGEWINKLRNIDIMECYSSANKE